MTLVLCCVFVFVFVFCLVVGEAYFRVNGRTRLHQLLRYWCFPFVFRFGVLVWLVSCSVSTISCE